MLGFALGIAGLALVSLALALCVGGLIVFTAGTLLTFVAIRRPAKPGRPPADAHGPFEPDTARQS